MTQVCLVDAAEQRSFISLQSLPWTAVIITMTIIPFSLLLWASWWWHGSVAKVVSVTGQIAQVGQFRYHYEDTNNNNNNNDTDNNDDNNNNDNNDNDSGRQYHHHSCQSLLLVGVGTAMTVTAYDHLAATVVTHDTNMVVVLLDANPGHVVKTNELQFATLANALVSQRSHWIPVCASTTTFSSSSPTYIIVGGHSASGQAALQAFHQKLFHFTVSGLVGLDPYRVTSTNAIPIPSIHFGFSSTTCGVSIDAAAQEGYLVSDPDHRVLFRINNTHGSFGSNNNDNNNDKKLATHCSFTDAGCFGIVCPAHDASTVWHIVATGMHDFVTALATNQIFTHASFPPPSSAGVVQVLVGNDPVTTVAAGAHTDTDTTPTTTPLPPAWMTGS